MSNQVKSKQRVVDHGEVFTSEREVNAMLDLVKQETERIDSRFLEPACGDGNFLAEILKRKLQIVKQTYKKSFSEYEKYSIVALSSIYGVELLFDNTLTCQKRLFDIWNNEYSSVCKNTANDKCRKIAQHILSLNILCGNALSMKRVDENGKDLEEPIIFAEWSFVGDKVKRRDFRLDVLLKENEDESMYNTQLSIFGDTADSLDYWEIDPVTNNPIPKAVKEYPMIDYRSIVEYE
ncbi:MAG: hypothetical protein KBS43_05890 [Oscillospiraceae bacterium]|nr:hypothetical protein [Candidatus Limimonas coprohippi]